MTRKGLVLMAAVLVVATAATAATAFAGDKYRRAALAAQTAENVQAGSLAMTRLRVKAVQPRRDVRPPAAIRMAAIHK